METGFWIVGGLLALVLLFQLYQWIEVNSAKRDMMRAYADAHRRPYGIPPARNPGPPTAPAEKPTPPPGRLRYEGEQPPGRPDRREE